MKRFKLPRLKLKRLNILGFLNYLIVVILSATFLALILISLPLTERVTSSATYDLVNKSTMYWAKDYLLELDTTKSINPQLDIQNTRSIIQKRLRKYGIEKSSTYVYKDGDITFLKISIQTSKEKDFVDTLVKTPFIVSVVTRKSDINFDDVDNPLTPYLIENYDITKFTRENFRNIYITQLKNSANEYSYFALFKTWPWEKEWDIFLNDNAGQTVGIAIDDFVTPVQIPVDQSLFAVSVSTTEKKDADIISILYNSGIVPINYTVKSELEIPLDIPEADYLKLTEGILIAVVLIYIYLLLIEKTPRTTLIKSGLSTLLTISLWISYLKISETPVDIFLLAIQVITVIAVIRIITENIESRIIVTTLLALILAICIVLGSGYIGILAYDLLILLILSNISLMVSSYYLSNVRKSLRI